jgi:transcriptional activator SPT7
MKRVRHTHAKLASLAATTAQPDDPDAPEGGLGGPSTSMGGVGGLSSGIQPPALDEDIQDDKIDERHWTDLVRGNKKGKLRIDEERANGCIRWVGEKVLEHAGFQGATRSSLDVFSGVFMEYLLNVGRNIRYLTDKYSQTMTSEVGFSLPSV